MRMFFFDIDGTLIDPKTGVISDRVRRAVYTLHSKGIIPVLVSGRPLFNMISIAESLEIRGCIAYNGGLAVVDGEIVYENPIEKDKLEQLISLAVENGHPVIFPGVDKYYATELDHRQLETLFKRPPVLDPFYFRNHPVYQVELIANSDQLDMYRKRFSTYFNFYPWHIVPCTAANVIPITNSKAVGMRHVLNCFSLDESDAVAIGDGPNDIEMIQFARIGIAMGNACTTLKSAANYVTDEVSRDGVAKVIEELVL